MTKSVFLVHETDHKSKKTNRDLIAVCTSSRTAVSLVLSVLLKRNEITSRELGKHRAELYKNNFTKDFIKNFSITEIEQNKVVT